MSPSTAVLIAVAAAVVIVIAVLVIRMQRHRRLRERFGPEYDRAVQDHSSKTKAERDLAEREKRHDKLDIRPLSEAEREHYQHQWALVQQRFVDRPGAAINEADQVLTTLMADRGYPTDGYEQQASDLSVEHAGTLEHYRAGREILQQHEKTSADTEYLRRAMVHYRTVFEDVLDGDRVSSRSDEGE